MNLMWPASSTAFDKQNFFHFFDPALEAAYREQKFLETRFLVVLVGFAASVLAVVLWSWDWAIDPENAGQVLWIRLVLGLILSVYPLGVLAGVRGKALPWLYAGVVLTTEGVFLYHLSFLETGLIYGIAGFMYWFILPVFLGLPFSVTVNSICFLAIALLPNLLVPMGVSPEFELIKYNVLIWPTCAIGIFITALLDQLYRMIFLYRRKAEERARIDDLTGIANRRHFLEVGEHLLENCRRYGAPVSIIMLDIDHFKPVNDTYGHPAGDQVLYNISGVFRESLRKSDFLGRYGGEEFAVILPRTIPAHAVEVAEKIRQKVKSTLFTVNGGTVIRLTVSAGVGGVDTAEGEISLEALVKQADDALYQAKRSGRNQVFFSEPAS